MYNALNLEIDSEIDYPSRETPFLTPLFFSLRTYEPFKRIRAFIYTKTVDKLHIDKSCHKKKVDQKKVD